MLQDLPISIAQTLVEEYSTDLETKTVRQVSKGWKSCIDSIIVALKPREFSRSQVTTKA